MQLILDCIPDVSDLSYTEYGCGPFSPFTSIANQYFKNGYRADIKKWDENVIECDLNKNIGNIPKSNIGVLSGVIEYLTSPESIFEKLGSIHNRLLLSYAPYIDGELEKRCIKKGWRNHYNLYDFIQITKYFGFIEHVGKWGGQTLLLLRNHRELV